MIITLPGIRYRTGVRRGGNRLCWPRMALPSVDRCQSLASVWNRVGQFAARARMHARARVRVSRARLTSPGGPTPRPGPRFEVMNHPPQKSGKNLIFHPGAVASPVDHSCTMAPCHRHWHPVCTPTRPTRTVSRVALVHVVGRCVAGVGRRFRRVDRAGVRLSVWTSTDCCTTGLTSGAWCSRVTAVSVWSVDAIQSGFGWHRVSLLGKTGTGATAH